MLTNLFYYYEIKDFKIFEFNTACDSFLRCVDPYHSSFFGGLCGNG